MSAKIPPGAEGVRLRRPVTASEVDAIQANAAKVQQHSSSRRPGREPMIRELLNRNERIWAPNFSTAVRLLFLIRFVGAMYTGISDCDETYNYWEPLHYLVKGSGFQTWEYSPLFALRSWGYLLVHALPPWIAGLIFPADKRPAFFALRITLAAISTLTECTLYRATVDHVSPRTGRYLLAMLIFNAGMWNASTAFLPSTFALHLTTLAFSLYLTPTSSKSPRRTYLTVLCFAASALVGWPFAALLAVPFAFEELFLLGLDRLPAGSSQSSWTISRFSRLGAAGAVAYVLVGLPLTFVDSLAYGKVVFVPWNLVEYNVFASKRGAGPELYGVDDWSFYLFNLLLSHNFQLSLALASVPLILTTSLISPHRLTNVKSANEAQTKDKKNAGQDETPVWQLLAIRAAPVYLWLAVVWTQPHKEERFMFPIYTLLCWNASVALTLVRGLAEVLFLAVTKSPYKAGRSSIFSTLTLLLLVPSLFVGVSRILALQNYYHAPLDVLFHLQHSELPSRAIAHFPQNYEHLGLDFSLPPVAMLAKSEKRVQFDLDPLKVENLTLCLGDQWYRFPTSWLVPDVVNVKFVKSKFDGILPRPFENVKGGKIWKRGGTSVVSEGFNDLNREEHDRYVPRHTCDYMLDLSFPHRPDASEDWTSSIVPSSAPASVKKAGKAAESAVASGSKGFFAGLRKAFGSASDIASNTDAAAIVESDLSTSHISSELHASLSPPERVFCSPFLDAQASDRLTRAFWMPFRGWQARNRWGEFCLLKKVEKR